MNKLILNTVFALFFPFLAFSQELPEDFYATNLDFTIDRPIGMKFDHLGNSFLFAKAGLIYGINAEGELQENYVLDISEEVTDWGDHGLVSLVLDPDFETNRHIYIFYTVDRHHMLYYGTPEYDPTIDIYNQASIGRIARYTLDYGQDEIIADESSRKVIFGADKEDGNPILMASHGVGTLAFGGDGSLMFSCGEAGSYTEFDIGNATDTFHEQAMEDGILEDYENIGAFRSMLRTNLSGKILRIDPETGDGIPNNPFYQNDNPSSKQSKIWAYGFRNPYKILYVPNTSTHTDDGDFPGKFLVGDVGSSYWEELNLVDNPGEWFGWPKFEGIHNHWAFKDAVLTNPETPNPNFAQGCGPAFYTFDDLVRVENRDNNYEQQFPCNGAQFPTDHKLFVHRRPIMSYSNDLWNPPAKTEFPYYNAEGNPIGVLIDAPENTVVGEVLEGGSAMPGAICDSELFPAEYRGELFMLDYHGWINVITLEEDKVKEIKKFSQLEKGITDLQFNPINGKLYYVHFTNGTVTEISYGGIRPPVASIEVDQFYGASPLTIQFNGSSSQSFDESDLTYEWTFGDGGMSTEANPSHTFDIGTQMLSYDVQLIVRDTSGNEDRARQSISVNNTPPVVDITSINEGDTYSQVTVNNFDLLATVTDAENSDTDLEYSWQVILHHSDHIHLGPIDNNHETYALIDPTGCTLESFHYEINLSVKDELGLIGKDKVGIFPYCGDDFSQFQNFEALFVEEGVQLNYDVTIEDNVEYYIVERTDDFQFEEIGRIPADGSNSYDFLDISPLDGVNRYRIRAMTTNRDRHYSVVRTINYHYSFGFTTGPNPVNNFFYIGVSKPFLETLDVRIFDLSGKLIYEFSEEYQNEHTVDLAINLANVPSGIYLYQLVVNGEVTGGKISKF